MKAPGLAERRARLRPRLASGGEGIDGEGALAGPGSAQTSTPRGRIFGVDLWWTWWCGGADLRPTPGRSCRPSPVVRAVRTAGVRCASCPAGPVSPHRGYRMVGRVITSPGCSIALLETLPPLRQRANAALHRRTFHSIPFPSRSIPSVQPLSQDARITPRIDDRLRAHGYALQAGGGACPDGDALRRCEHGTRRRNRGGRACRRRARSTTSTPRRLAPCWSAAALAAGAEESCRGPAMERPPRCAEFALAAGLVVMAGTSRQLDHHARANPSGWKARLETIARTADSTAGGEPGARGAASATCV